MGHAPFRILHVISGLGLGGAERMVLWSARRHDRTLFKMGVVSLMSGGALAGELGGTGIELVELGWAKGRLSPGGFRALAEAVDRFEPDILQGHMFHSNMLTRLLKVSRPGLLVVNTRHIDYQRIFRRLLNGATGFLCAGTIVFSGRVMEEERRESLFGRPICLAPYGIDLPAADECGRMIRPEIAPGRDDFLWVAVGRLMPQKGYPLMLRAFALLPSNARLLVVGEGPERPRLERETASLSISGRVSFAGNRTDVPSLLSAADGFVLSSVYEGGPLAVLEAMAAGLPVVATDVGDVPEMVQDGVTGLVVPVRDPRMLAEAMSSVMSMGQAAAEWGQEGRRRVLEKYSFSRTQSAMERFYLSLLGERNPS